MSLISPPSWLTTFHTCLCIHSSQLLASAAEDEDTLYEEDEEEGLSGSESGCEGGDAEQGRGQHNTPAGAVPLKAAWRLFKLLKTATDRVVQSLLHVKRLLKVRQRLSICCLVVFSNPHLLELLHASLAKLYLVHMP
jgi:hypothetical protein